MIYFFIHHHHRRTGTRRRIIIKIHFINLDVCRYCRIIFLFVCAGGSRRGLDRRERFCRVHDKRRADGRDSRDHVRQGRRPGDGQDLRQRRLSAGQHGRNQTRTDSRELLVVQSDDRAGRRP